MSNTIKTFVNESTKQYAVLSYNVFVESPRNWAEGTRICIRKHRHYDFPNELDFEFDSEDDDTIQAQNATLENFYIFNLDCYEHGSTHFSLSGSGTQCRFDTSSAIGFIAISKKIAESETEAKQIAECEIAEYTYYCNGECYRMDIYSSEGEFNDCDNCIGDCDTITERLPSGFVETSKTEQEILLEYAIAKAYADGLEAGQTELPSNN